MSADSELKLNIRSSTFSNTSNKKESNEEINKCFNLDDVKERIQENIEILGDFTNRRKDGKSRADYLKVFCKDLCSYYSYNEFLMGKFMELFPNGSEVIYFFLNKIIF